jgi:8-oxo-dGTP diphosphatase
VDKKVLYIFSREKDTHYLPGGKREPNETDQQALMREILEELRVNLDPETIQLLGKFTG